MSIYYSHEIININNLPYDMTMKILGTRLLIAIRKAGYKTYQEFADQVGISYQSISNYINNHRYPTLNHLLTMANILEVNVGWLLGETNEKELWKTKTIKLPLLKLEEINDWLKDPVISNYKNIDIGSIKNISHCAYMVEIEDDSMSTLKAKGLAPGEKIIVDPSSAPEIGDLIIVKVDLNTMILELCKQGTQCYLKSYQTGFPPLLFDEKVKVLGVIIEKRFHYKI